MLTTKEKAVLKLLMTSVDSDYSINNIAKMCGLAPNGAFKILKKFEKEGILTTKKIANIKSYKINFENTKSEAILELVLTSTPEGRIQHRFEDLKELQEITKSSILFGSYITSAKEPHDMDVLFVLDKEKFKEFKNRLSTIKDIILVRIHDVIQTEIDLKNNLLKKDKIIIDILQKGIVLWGQRTILKVIKDVYQRKNQNLL
jgi:DNA-binding Lrp family transcriptional regulator